ncbi:MAG: hypothetical protein ISS82_00180 [Nanoarchaeota archaeon]|nr:hypothetical protein [Nanoarchaeota archaeon]
MAFDRKKMALDRKTTIVALSILLIAVLVGLNFEKFTGKYTWKTEAREAEEVVLSKVYVSNDPSVVKMDNPTVKIGKKVYFTVEVGSEGCRRKISIYEKNGGARQAQIELDQNCGGNKCRPDRITWADYRIPNHWEGEYCGRVWDYSTGQYLTPGGCFTV